MPTCLIQIYTLVIFPLRLNYIMLPFTVIWSDTIYMQEHVVREMNNDIDELTRLLPLSNEPNLPDLFEANFRVMSNRVFPSRSGLPFRHESCDPQERKDVNICVSGCALNASQGCLT